MAGKARSTGEKEGKDEEGQHIRGRRGLREDMSHNEGGPGGFPRNSTTGSLNFGLSHAAESTVTAAGASLWRIARTLPIG
jgi:hypothetical protein